MIVLGLTGSIGMGKTTVAGMFESLGVPSLDSDLVVHELLKAPSIVARVGKIFPSAVKKGVIDRSEIGKAVFNNPELLKKLEIILHPKVQAAQKEFIRRCKRRGSRMVILDIPLLFETKAEKRMDYVVVATAPRRVQKERVMKRPGMTEEKFKSILRRQMPDTEKRKKADFLVHTGDGKARSLKEVKAILKRLMV